MIEWVIICSGHCSEEITGRGNGGYLMEYLVDK